MFTGIIEQIATVQKNHKGRLAIIVDYEFSNDISIGSSIALNGACLTIIDAVRSSSTASLVFDLTDETKRCTNLKFLRIGDRVNLEKAISACGRFEGHIVLGHIDTIAQVKSLKFKTRRAKEAILTIKIPVNFHKYIVPKGSIAIDGVSLTIVDLVKDFFTTAIIPHTLKNTIVKYYKEGTAVNLEMDITAKYVEGIMR